MSFCPRCGTGVARNGVTPTPLTATRPAQRVGPNAVQCGTCGTQMVPGLQFCFACGAPVLLDEQGPAPTRMQAEEPTIARRKMSTTMKILIGIGVVMLCTFAACGACLVAAFKAGVRNEVTFAEQRSKVVSPELAARMPTEEVMFCQAVDKASQEARAAGGLNAPPELLTKLLEERRGALYALSHDPKVSNWVGLVTHMQVSDGAADVEIQLPCDATLTSFGAWPKPTEEPGHFDMERYAARRGTPAYAAIVQVAEGDTVTFSGKLGADSKGELRLLNASDRARVMAPTFLIEVGDVRNDPRPSGTKPPSGAPAEASDGG